MANKRKHKSATLCAILLLAFCVPSLAHSGRTDANGGHWNHATGEYHYHTGEYAGRSSSSKSSSSKSSKKADDSSSTENNIELTDKGKKKLTFWDVAKPILAVHIAFFPIVVGIYYYIFTAVIKFIKKIFNRK